MNAKKTRTSAALMVFVIILKAVTDVLVRKGINWVMIRRYAKVSLSDRKALDVIA